MSDAPGTPEAERSLIAAWLLLAMPLLLGGSVLLLTAGGTEAIRHLLPPVEGGGGMLALDGLCLLIILLAPLGWRIGCGRRALVASLCWGVCVAGSVAVGLALASRVLPVSLAWGMRAAGAVCLFAIASFLLYQLLPRGYVAVQLLLAGTGPFCAWFLGQIISSRTGRAASFPALYAPSIFSALRHAATEPTYYRVSMILYATLTVALALALWLRSPKTEAPTAAPAAPPSIF